VCRWHDEQLVYFKEDVTREDALRDPGVSEDTLELIGPVTGTVRRAASAQPYRTRIHLLLLIAEGVAQSSRQALKRRPEWAADENRTPDCLLSGGQPVLVEFQEVVSGRQQAPLGQHG
jgi:hypothetical protein